MSLNAKYNKLQFQACQNATEILAAVSQHKKFSVILVHGTKVAVELKCLPPIGYNSELRKNPEKDWLIQMKMSHDAPARGKDPGLLENVRLFMSSLHNSHQTVIYC
jgi:hypothetical protein